MKSIFKPFLIVLLILFAVSRCVGQNKVLYHSLEASFIGLEAMDVITTYHGFKVGAHEANPIMTGIVRHPAELIAVKGIITFGSLACFRAIRKDHPKTALACLIAANLTMGYVVHHNYQIILSFKIK